MMNYMKDCTMLAVDLWAEQPDNNRVAGEKYTAAEGWKHDKAWRVLNQVANEPFYANRFKLMRMRTDDAAKLVEDKSLDFVFIDADHSYEGCRADIENWLPKVRAGGFISGHDFDWNTVGRAVNDTGGYHHIADDNVWIRYV
jgi:hypothetical protein